MTDRGHAAVELALGVAVLLLPVALVVLSFGPWSERRVLAEIIAAEASRIAVLEGSETAGASLASSIVTSHGLESGMLRLGWCGALPAVGSSGECELVRGGVVTLEAEVWVPLISTPWGNVGGLWASASHSEPVDLYRSLP